jgi:type IV pilus assembly protein PilA
MAVEPERQRTRAHRLHPFGLLGVVAVIGILLGIILPQYRKASAAAQVAGVVNSAVSYAMQCRQLALTDIGSPPPPPPTITMSCTTDGGSVSAALPEGVDGIRCIKDLSEVTDLSVKLLITNEGLVSCVFS